MGVRNIFFGQRKGKRPLGRPKGAWEDNIKMNLNTEWQDLCDLI
jgi:hypothetical protein